MDQHSFDQHNFSQHSLKQHSFIEEIQGNESGIFEKYIGQAKIVQLLSGSERPLVTIGAKAFLSCKSIEKLILPDTLERVADWGFAHMKNLREITLPAREILFGKKVFLGCENLQKVYLIHSERENKLCGSVKQSTVDSLYEGLPYFLASMFRFFPENRLENLEMAGDEQGQWEWLTAYDEALQAYVQRPHDYDFEPAFIGWFDIEDVDDQKQNFIVQQRKNKIRLAFQRLNYDEKLPEAFRKQLAHYLLQERALVEENFLSDDEALGKDIEDYRVWEQVGGLDQECAGRLLAGIPEEEPEIRGYLLKIQLEHVENQDFFAELDL